MSGIKCRIEAHSNRMVCNIRGAPVACILIRWIVAILDSGWYRIPGNIHPSSHRSHTVLVESLIQLCLLRRHTEIIIVVSTWSEDTSYSTIMIIAIIEKKIFSNFFINLFAFLFCWFLTFRRKFLSNIRF